MVFARCERLGEVEADARLLLTDSALSSGQSWWQLPAGDPSAQFTEGLEQVCAHRKGARTEGDDSCPVPLNPERPNNAGPLCLCPPRGQPCHWPLPPPPCSTWSVLSPTIYGGPEPSPSPGLCSSNHLHSIASPISPLHLILPVSISTRCLVSPVHSEPP